MKQYAFEIPSKIKYGPGVLNHLTELISTLNISKVLLVTDQGIVKAGLAEKVLKIINDSGTESVVLSDIEPNPRDVTISKGTKLLKEQKCDMVVGLGGGSSLDAAKCISIMLDNPGVINDYEGFYKFKNHATTPVVSIPTTSGTGAEISGWAVITDSKRNHKMGIGSHDLSPAYSLVDPLMTMGLPPKLTATTGMDALTHAIEAYTVIITSPIVELLAIHAIRLIANNLGKAVAYGDDIEARSNMSYASLIAGMAMTNSDCGAVHSCAETLGGFYDLPHGLTIAIMLPVVMEYNLIASEEKYANIAEAMGQKICGLTKRGAAIKAIEAIKQMLTDFDIPTLKEIGVKESDVPELSKLAEFNLSAVDNPRKVTREDFEKLYIAALKK